MLLWSNLGHMNGLTNSCVIISQADQDWSNKAKATIESCLKIMQQVACDCSPIFGHCQCHWCFLLRCYQELEALSSANSFDCRSSLWKQKWDITQREGCLITGEQVAWDPFPRVGLSDTFHCSVLLDWELIARFSPLLIVLIGDQLEKEHGITSKWHKNTKQWSSGCPLVVSCMWNMGGGGRGAGNVVQLTNYLCSPSGASMRNGCTCKTSILLRTI